MFKSKMILVLLSMIVLVGCGYNQTTTQSRDVGYLKFNKHDNSNYYVVVNDKYEIKLEKCIQNENTPNCFQDTKNKLYELTSGNLNIKVFDNKRNLIIDKNLYLGSSSTVEVDF